VDHTSIPQSVNNADFKTGYCY